MSVGVPPKTAEGRSDTGGTDDSDHGWTTSPEPVDTAGAGNTDNELDATLDEIFTNFSQAEEQQGDDDPTTDSDTVVETEFVGSTERIVRPRLAVQQGPLPPAARTPQLPRRPLMHRAMSQAPPPLPPRFSQSLVFGVRGPLPGTPLPVGHHHMVPTTPVGYYLVPATPVAGFGIPSVRVNIYW